MTQDLAIEPQSFVTYADGRSLRGSCTYTGPHIFQWSLAGQQGPLKISWRSEVRQSTGYP